jgi:shikimate kinase
METGTGNIMLVGPKHSGKTSVGKALAALCSGVFIDLDAVIAEHSGKSPRALYTEGPAVFRMAEAEALTFLLETQAASGTDALTPTVIIAAGGGIIDNAAALALIETNKTLLPVYLDVSVETAWERIAGAGELPPFLKTENPRDTHRTLHRQRAAAYRQFARLIIKAEGKSPRRIARDILARLPDVMDMPFEYPHS